MSDVLELFGEAALHERGPQWDTVLGRQWRPFLDRKCIKVRKSEPEISIGTCSVLYGRAKRPIVICPYRLLERGQIFTDCLHPLSMHEPGNEIHTVPEVSVPGGSVDYFLVSVRDRKVRILSASNCRRWLEHGFEGYRNLSGPPGECKRRTGTGRSAARSEDLQANPVYVGQQVASSGYPTGLRHFSRPFRLTGKSGRGWRYLKDGGYR